MGIEYNPCLDRPLLPLWLYDTKGTHVENAGKLEVLPDFPVYFRACSTMPRKIDSPVLVMGSPDGSVAKQPEIC